MKLDSLSLWNTHEVGACAFQMSLDEALFIHTRAHDLAVARFYRWKEPALTFGYSEPHPDRVSGAAVRRFTGGGIVEHETDLTFLLTLPASSAVAREPAAIRYEWIHSAIRNALQPVGVSLTLAEESDPRATGPCFETPVLSDLISEKTGIKIGGGAQRRSRGAVIHQGSIRLPEALRVDHHEWTTPLLTSLADQVIPFPEPGREEVLANAERLQTSRYQSREWNHRR